MEVSKEFYESLKKNAKEVSIELKEGEGLSSLFSKLAEMGKRGEIVKCKGFEIYSFMTEDEMAMQMMGKTKAQVEDLEYESRDKRLSDKRFCNGALKEDFPKWKKIIEESYPKEKAKQILDSAKKGLESGERKIAYKMYSMVSILQSAKEGNVKEAQEKYLASDASLSDRLTLEELSASFYSDMFKELIIEDIKAFPSSFQAEHIKRIEDNAAKAKQAKEEQKTTGEDMESLFKVSKEKEAQKEQGSSFESED